MDLRERFYNRTHIDDSGRTAVNFTPIKTTEEVQPQTPSVNIPVENTVKKEPLLEDAIYKIVHKEHWDKLYNDIIDNPSREGKYPKNFGNQTIDLLWFENYMLKALPWANLKKLMYYKNIALYNKLKGYTKLEDIRSR